MIGALDATPLVEPAGGIARYVAELSRALASCFGGDEWWLVSDQSVEALREAPANLHLDAQPRGFIDKRWWLFGIARQVRQLRADVFHGTDFAVPYRHACASVMTIHDLSPWKNAPIRAAGARVRRRTPLLLRRRLADMIVTPSEAIRREATEFFGLPPDRVVTTPLAAAVCFHPMPVVATPARPYFLYAGMLDARKNVETIVAAWREVKQHHDIDLILAGQHRTSSISGEPGLHIRESTTDAELASLYSRAIAFLFPSLYEGFGLPILEAMQCGAPVIISRDAALIETAGDAAVSLDATNVRAWRDTMTAAIRNHDWRATMRDRGLARARQFSWQRTASLTREVYAEAIARFRRNA